MQAIYPDLKWRTALVTGASSGIGRGIAQALEEQGMRVGWHYRTQKPAGQVALQADLGTEAGCLRLADRVLDVYEGRWLNVHPALLPAFPGMHGVRDALAYGVHVTGVTVHLVDEGVDSGPIVLQGSVEVRPDDDRDSLEPRIHELEHRLLPQAVRAMIEGRLRLDGRRVRIVEEGP